MVYHPEHVINRYVWDQFKTYAPNFYNLYAQTSGGSEIIPFFPAPVSNVPSEMIESDKPYILFDKFTRVRNDNNLYSVKTDQMRYTIVGGVLSSGVSGGNAVGERDRYATTIDLSSLIYRILDREDDAARDINEFGKNLNGYLTSNDMYKYYFHKICVYQSGFTDTQTDVDNFMEYNPSRDLIIRYDYHFTQFNEK